MWFDTERTRNRGLLLLTRGVSDIGILGRVEAACRDLIGPDERSGFEWHDVADLSDLSVVDPLFDYSGLTRVEAGEFIDLDDAELAELLSVTLDRMRRLEPHWFPSAGGAVGNPAEGVQLIARENDLSALQQLLDGGTHVVLLAPRRSGKTSVLMELRRRHRTNTLYLDLERSTSPREVAGRAATQVLGQSIMTSLKQVDERDWAAVLSDALGALARRDAGWSLLLLDELQELLANMGAGPDRDHGQEAVAFLESLSRVVVAADVRVVIAGSVDLRDDAYRRWGIRQLPGLFGAMEPFRLAPLDTSPVVLRRVLLGTGLVPEAGDLDWLRGHVDLALPYPALVFLDKLDAAARRHGSLSVPQLDEHLDEFLAETPAFDDIEQRALRKADTHADLLERTARLINRLLAGAPGQAVSLRDVQDTFSGLGQPGELVSWFEETFPVVRDGETVTLTSRLFRQWWQRRGWGG